MLLERHSKVVLSQYSDENDGFTGGQGRRREGGMGPRGPDIKLLDWISYPRGFRCEQYVNRLLPATTNLGFNFKPPLKILHIEYFENIPKYYPLFCCKKYFKSNRDFGHQFRHTRK